MKQVPVAAKLEYLCRGEVILGDVIQAGNTQWGEKTHWFRFSAVILKVK